MKKSAAYTWTFTVFLAIPWMKMKHTPTDLNILLRLNTYQLTILYRGLSPFCTSKGSATRIDQGRHDRSTIASTLQSASLTYCNLMKDELQALKWLKNDKDIVILPAYEGRVTVVMDKKYYSNNMKSLVNDKLTCKPLTNLALP